MNRKPSWKFVGWTRRNNLSGLWGWGYNLCRLWGIIHNLRFYIHTYGVLWLAPALWLVRFNDRHVHARNWCNYRGYDGIGRCFVRYNVRWFRHRGQRRSAFRIHSLQVLILIDFWRKSNRMTRVRRVGDFSNAVARSSRDILARGVVGGRLRRREDYRTASELCIRCRVFGAALDCTYFAFIEDAERRELHRETTQRSGAGCHDCIIEGLACETLNKLGTDCDLLPTVFVLSGRGENDRTLRCDDVGERRDLDT